MTNEPPGADLARELLHTCHLYDQDLVVTALGLVVAALSSMSGETERDLFEAIIQHADQCTFNKENYIERRESIVRYARLRGHGPYSAQPAEKGNDNSYFWYVAGPDGRTNVLSFVDKSSAVFTSRVSAIEIARAGNNRELSR